MRHIPIILFAALTLTACVSRTPLVDQRFGHAVSAAKARQTIDPQAASKMPEPAGIDGAAANESMLRYRDSFKSPPPTFIIINGAGTTQ
jgi:hypothetical protein